MNQVIKITIFCYLCSIASCIPVAEPARHLPVGIWTDLPAASLVGIQLLANDGPIGELTSLSGPHDCASPELLHFEIPFDSSTTFSILDKNGAQIEIATIEIFGLNTGMSIDKHGSADLEIDGTSDDRCTQIYLAW